MAKIGSRRHLRPNSLHKINLGATCGPNGDPRLPANCVMSANGIIYHTKSCVAEVHFEVQRVTSTTVQWSRKPLCTSKLQRLPRVLLWGRAIPMRGVRTQARGVYKAYSACWLDGACGARGACGASRACGAYGATGCTGRTGRTCRVGIPPFKDARVGRAEGAWIIRRRPSNAYSHLSLQIAANPLI